MEWNQTIIHKLESIEERDPKEYWKMINELREKKKSGTDISDLDSFTNFSLKDWTLLIKKKKKILFLKA